MVGRAEHETAARSSSPASGDRAADARCSKKAAEVVVARPRPRHAEESALRHQLTSCAGGTDYRVSVIPPARAHRQVCVSCTAARFNSEKWLTLRFGSES